MFRNEHRPTFRGVEDLLDPALMSRIERLDYRTRRVLAGRLKGERRSRRRGQSVEFADHRPYVVGDDIRHIDWSIYARLDRLFLKLFLEEEDLSLHLVLDASGSVGCGTPDKFAFIQRAAMALGYIGLTNYHRVSATAIGEGSGGIRSAIRDLRGRRRAHDLARWIADLTPGGSPPFAQACTRIALQRRGRGVMVLLSDFLIKGGYEAGLRVLTGRGYQCCAVQVLSPHERDPLLPDGLAGDLRLRDTEDGDAAEITVSAPLIRRYRATLDAYTERLRVFCARRDITFLSVTSDTPLDALILEYLRHKGILT